MINLTNFDILVLENAGYVNAIEFGKLNFQEDS